jgi:hypothetical protein
MTPLSPPATPRKVQPPHRLQISELTPIHLDFSLTLPPSLSVNLTCPILPSKLTRLPQSGTQTKITRFFITLHKCSSIPKSAPGPVPKCQTHKPYTKRNAIRNKLLTYHLSHTSTSSQKQLSTPIPHYDLLDSCGHSLPIIDCSAIFRVFSSKP